MISMRPAKLPSRKLRVVVHLDQVKNPTGFGPPLRLTPYEAPAHLTEREVTRMLSRSVDDRYLAAYPLLLTEVVPFLANLARTNSEVDSTKLEQAIEDLAQIPRSDWNASGDIVKSLEEGGLLFSDEDNELTKLRLPETGTPPPMTGLVDSVRWALAQVAIDPSYADGLAERLLGKADASEYGLACDWMDVVAAIEDTYEKDIRSNYKPDTDRLRDFLLRANVIIDSDDGDLLVDRVASGRTEDVQYERYRDLYADLQAAIRKVTDDPRDHQDFEKLYYLEKVVAVLKARRDMYEKAKSTPTPVKPEKRSEQQRPFDGHVRLQGIGEVPARKAENLRVGDVLVFSYGLTYEVLKLRPSRVKSVGTHFPMIDAELRTEYGKLETKQLRVGYLVGVSPQPMVYEKSAVIEQPPSKPDKTTAKPPKAAPPAKRPTKPKKATLPGKTYIASRTERDKSVSYVSQLPGQDGPDWGYTDDYRKALPLSKYWLQRFASDQRKIGRPSTSWPVSPSIPAAPHILDSNLIERLARFEGDIWAQRQSEDPLDPGRIPANVQAFQVLASLGQDGAGITLDMLLPGAGTIVGDDTLGKPRLYHVGTDGIVRIDIPSDGISEAILALLNYDGITAV